MASAAHRCAADHRLRITDVKNGESSYKLAQSSKNRANVFVISNTLKICLGWAVQLFRCVNFFVPRDLIYGNIREYANAFFQ
jgi:hypothetical protein